MAKNIDYVMGAIRWHENEGWQYRKHGRWFTYTRERLFEHQALRMIADDVYHCDPAALIVTPGQRAVF